MCGISLRQSKQQELLILMFIAAFGDELDPYMLAGVRRNAEEVWIYTFDEE